MNDLSLRYESVTKQMAALYSADESLRALSSQLEAVRVIAEEWDVDRSGGHFYFETPLSTPVVENLAYIDAFANDADGATICITLHFVEGRLNWAEWYREPADGQPIQTWPPVSIRGAP